jgi:cell division protein FtsW
MISRADQSLLTDWWFSNDRTLVALVLLLVFCGALVSLAVTPSAALRLGFEPLYFAKRHIATLGLSLLLMLAVSLLDARAIRRLALALFVGSIVLMVLALLQGIERNGAARWVFLGGLVIQPSEFAKPGFVVLAAWAFAESVARPDMPARALAFCLLALFAALLVLQPDLGQAFLVAAIWAGLFFLAGYPLTYIPAAAAAGIGGIVGGYLVFPHFASRIDRFVLHGGDTQQADVAAATFRDAGWLHPNLGEVFVRSRLPDAHNDYVFAALAGQAGIAACLFLVLLYGLIVWRGMRAAAREQDSFLRLAIAGLVMLFGFQALTNIAVNLNLLPAKGMTLPLVSYGRSSLLSSAIALGMLASLTRRWPGSHDETLEWAAFRDGLIPLEEVRR